MDIKRKLNSRKLWASIIGVITGIAMIFGADEGIASAIAGAAAVIISVVTYIITEGKLDAEGLRAAIDAVKDGEQLAGAGGRAENGGGADE